MTDINISQKSWAFLDSFEAPQDALASDVARVRSGITIEAFVEYVTDGADNVADAEAYAREVYELARHRS